MMMDLIYLILKVFWYTLPGPEIVDDDPPLLVLPKDIFIEATSDYGAVVTYPSVGAFDAVDQEITPVCDPPSGSEFKKGYSKVECSATDSAGNKATGEFNVVVTAGGVSIPEWMKNNARYWGCEPSTIDTETYVTVIQWMIDNYLIVIPPSDTAAATTGSAVIPDWIKENSCWWADGLIDNKTYATTIQWLITNGIIIL